MGPTIVFRTTSARVYAVIFWVVAVVLLVAFATNGGLGELLQYGAVPLVLVAVGWAVFWQPHVVVAPAGVTAANVFTTVDVPWLTIDAVETRWGLRLETADGRVNVWAAPAKGGISNRRREPDVPGVDLLDTEGTGRLSATGDSRLVGQVIEARLAAARAGGVGTTGRTGEPAAPTQVRKRVNAVSIGLLAGSLALAVLTATTLG
ncbi:PH domain-containing protein [Georgenia subflava]|nr:PH domain-containing protein [Georgenia subflava]